MQLYQDSSTICPLCWVARQSDLASTKIYSTSLVVIVLLGHAVHPRLVVFMSRACSALCTPRLFDPDYSHCPLDLCICLLANIIITFY
jgi:hypothetical protein